MCQAACVATHLTKTPSVCTDIVNCSQRIRCATHHKWWPRDCTHCSSLHCIPPCTDTPLAGCSSHHQDLQQVGGSRKELLDTLMNMPISIRPADTNQTYHVYYVCLLKAYSGPVYASAFYSLQLAAGRHSVQFSPVYPSLHRHSPPNTHSPLSGPAHKHNNNHLFIRGKHIFFYS